MFRWVTRWGTVEPRRLSASGALLILRRRAELAGPEGIEGITPHSLRAGFVTEAYRAGLRVEAIMQHTRHRDLASMRRYVRRARLLEDSAAAASGCDVRGAKPTCRIGTYTPQKPGIGGS